MLRRILPMVAILATFVFASTANATLYPFHKTNIHNTATLQSALKESPEALALVTKNSGGGNAKPSDFVYCGTVTPYQRKQLAQQGYKNTAVDSNGNKQRLRTLKSGTLRWACRVNTSAIASSLKSKLGSGVHCYTSKFKSGTVTVRCEGAHRTYEVKAPKRRAAIGGDCTNVQDKGGPTTPDRNMSGEWTAWSTITVKKGETITCPNGASATVTATAKARGFGHGTTLYAAKKMAKANAYAKVTVNGHCGIIAPPPVNPPANPGITCNPGYVLNSQGICVQIVVECKAGEIRDANGVCVTQTNTAEQNCKAVGGTFNGATQLCTIIQVNGSCSNIIIVNGSGNTVNSYQEGNCNTQPPPVDHKPQISCVLLAHIYYPRGTAQLACKATDPDGDPIDPNINATGAAHASGTLETPNYGKDPCPPGYTCYTTRIDADYVGFVTITATAIANGVPSIPWLGTYPVEQDDFGSY